MSSYGELIQALGTLKNVKEKRHGIKTLASLCASRAFQVRIVQRGGWRDAILPLIISLDEGCRKYAALAIANLSTCTAAHRQLLEEEVLRRLVPVLLSEESHEVILYVLNAIGNFACSSITWPDMHHVNTIEAVVSALKQAQTEETTANALFCISNLSSDPHQRAWMLEHQTHELIWGYMKHPNYRIMQYSLAILRGLSVEPPAQRRFAKIGLVPMLIGIYQSSAPVELKTLALDIFLHLSFAQENAGLLMESELLLCIEHAARGAALEEHVPVGVAIVANLCESKELHERILESPLFEVLREHMQDDRTAVQQHVVRAMMQLSLSPQYHHVLLSTGVVANVCPIAMTETLPIEMRSNALQMLGAICATHPTTPIESDVMDIMFLVCNAKEHVDIRRAGMMVLANASADVANQEHLLRKPFVEALVTTLSEAADVVLVDYLMQFFHNLCRLGTKAASLLVQCGYQRHMFSYERLESLSVASSIYLCDTCRQLCEDAEVRGQLMEGMLFTNLLDAWVTHIRDLQIAPHLALMCSAFAYHSDTHQDFVLQGGVRLVIDLYSHSHVEHVRLCCLLSVLYLTESGHSQRSIAQERGMQMLLMACENETHIDLITNALKALIPFASSDDYRPQLGMDGAIDVFASFLFSDQLSLQQLGIFLLQSVLELRANRRIFLGLAEERSCDESYLEPLVRFLPKALDPRKLERLRKRKQGRGAGSGQAEAEASSLTAHDPFLVRSAIHCLALLSLEHHHEVYRSLLDLQVPQLLHCLFYSEQIDKSAGEAVLLFFANLLHGSVETQTTLLKSLDILPMLLSCRELEFARETNCRCMSAMVSISRSPDFRSKVMGQLDSIMANVSANLNAVSRDEIFYSTAALHCTLLGELARASQDFHERMAKAGVVEALLVFLTSATHGLNDGISVELMLSAVFGIAALVSSPTYGEQCMTNLLFPATRFQLFMSLLRKPEQEEICSAFHFGTVGLKTLQRTMEPAILPEELHVDCLDAQSFVDRCSVPPADFLYRNVVRTLCLLLAHPQMGRRVQEGMTPQNIVPTCVLALRGTTDIYVQTFGYLLVAKFSSDPTLLHSFVDSAVVVNELLTSCRCYVSPDGDGKPAPGRPIPRPTGKSTGPWSPKSIATSQYLLAMLALSNLAESIKEKYKPETVDPQDEGKLTDTDCAFLRKLTATSFRDLDCDAMLTPHQMSGIQEFTALLRVIVVHNSCLARIALHGGTKGGEVALEPVGAKAMPTPKAEPKGADLVPLVLREEFETLGAVQRKIDGVLDVVGSCLEANAALPLARALVECLCGITFLSPLSISKPHCMYRIIKICPDWLQPSMCCLFANLLAHKSRTKAGDLEAEDDPLAQEESDYLFPLVATSLVETRQHMIGALANLATQRGLLSFIERSGVFRLCKPFPSRGHFLEHFACVLQLCRLLANLMSSIESYTQQLLGLLTPDLVGFLRDVLHNTAELLQSGEMKVPDKQEPAYDCYGAVFGEDDVPPLGLKIWWEMPPRISEVLPGTPASRMPVDFRPGDELVAVNGADVSQLPKQHILPMFEARPLELLFRRRMAVAPTTPGEPDVAASVQLQEVERLECYGDRPQYLECFHLALITLHNLATLREAHERLLSDPKVVEAVLDVLPSDVLSPSLRRLAFSTLACLAQNRALSGPIFQAMREYFVSCSRADASLNKYVMLCANLFYTGTKPEEVWPDQGMMAFVGQLSATESAASSDAALVEVLHGMARAPQELRRALVSRETLLTAVNSLENKDQWGLQLRAYEAVYFLTLSACQPDIWASLHVLPRMVHAAGVLQQRIAKDPAAWPRAHAVWDLALRTAQLCLQHAAVVRTLSTPDLDRYLAEVFGDSSQPTGLVQRAADVMAGLLQTEAGGSCWSRWRSLGLAERLVQWFGALKEELRGGSGAGRQRPRGIGEDSAGTCLDSVLHMLVHLVETDAGIVPTLVAEDVTACIASQILSLASTYQRCQAAAAGSDYLCRADAEDAARTNTSFRVIAQLLTALAASEHGLAAMSRLNLEPALVSLLELPANDLRSPALLILCVLSGHKQSCAALLRHSGFMGLLQKMEKTLKETAQSVSPQELEYLSCLLDRSCCHPELARVVLEELFQLLCLLPMKAATADARLLATRALCRCALEVPGCLGRLPEDGPACLHYLMELASCLRSGGTAGSPASTSKPDSCTDVAGAAARQPSSARLTAHFARAALCESVSTSRNVCRSALPDLDCLALLDDVARAFDAAYAGIDHKGMRVDIAAAEAMNNLVAMLHIVLCVLFRQGMQGELHTDAEEDAARDVVASLARVIEVVCRCLRLGDVSSPQAGAPTVIAERLTADIRVLFYLTALLREACTRPQRPGPVCAVPEPTFLLALEGSIRLALRRLHREAHGPAPKELLAGAHSSGASPSPLTVHLKDLGLALVFEHLLVCLRQLLVQAVYAAAPAADDGSHPWGCRAQAQLAVHTDALTWLPDVARRYRTVLAIRVEAVRYLCAISCFNDAPEAPPQDAEALHVKSQGSRGHWEGDRASLSALQMTYSLVEPRVLELLTSELETSEDPCTLALACMAVANFAKLEQQRRLRDRSRSELPVDELSRLVIAVIRTLQYVPSLQQEVEAGVACALHAISCISSLLTFKDARLTCSIMGSGVLESVSEVFDFYFLDVFKIRSEKDYTATLRGVVLFLRNWVTVGCATVRTLGHRGSSVGLKSPKSEGPDLCLELDTLAMLNLMVKVASKLVSMERKLPDQDAVCDSVFEDLLLSFRTLLDRASEAGPTSWERLHQEKFEALLERMKEHRHARAGRLEDESLMSVLFLLTKQAFTFKRSYFPDYMMEVAYGQQQEHTTVQDVAAVCCAMISTRSSKGKGGPTSSVADVVKDYAAFICSLAKVKDARMRLWHYRLIAGQSRRAKLLDQVSADDAALGFVVETLLDPTLGRYSITILHNVSVHRCSVLLRSGKCFGTVCEAYRRLGQGPPATDKAQSWQLRRLLMAILRNCILFAKDLDKELSDADLAALLTVVDCLDKADTPLYLAVLLNLCRKSVPARRVAALPSNAQVVELLLRCFMEKVSACQPSSFAASENTCDLYGLRTDEDSRQQGEAHTSVDEPVPLSPAAAQSAESLAQKRRPSDAPVSPARGLGKRTNPWQHRSRSRAATSAPAAGPKKLAPSSEASSGPARPRASEHEFAYFAAAEVLTSATFHDVAPEAVAGSSIPRQPSAAAVGAVDAAFRKYPINLWLSKLREQVELHENRRVCLSNLFVHVSAKFIWHCWSQRSFRAHADSPSNLEALAAVTPFFLAWPSAAVQHLIAEVSLYAGLHRYEVVSNYLAEHHGTHPELSCALLTHALVDAEASIKLKQAHKFIATFVGLLTSRSLSRGGLKRLVVGLETALLSNRPERLCTYLLQQAHSLLGEMLRALCSYNESSSVRQCMVVAISQTLGAHYQPLPQLDELVLLLLDLAGPLLDSEFVLFMPVLHRLAVRGGRRAVAQIFAKQLHMRVARLLEEAIASLEVPPPARGDAPAERSEEESGAGPRPQLAARQRLQWHLAFLTALAGSGEVAPAPVAEGARAAGRAGDPHFEAFVCVDLLPSLVRVLRAAPQAFEALSACFLVSSVAASSCVPPYMPDVLRLAEQSLLPLLARSGGLPAATGQGPAGACGTWRHLALPTAQRMELGLRRSFVHLLGSAGFQPAERPALLSSGACLGFLLALQCDPELFADPTAPLHSKLYCLAQLSARKEGHLQLLEHGILDALQESQHQLLEAAELVEEASGEACDLRVQWIHSVLSLMMQKQTAAQLLAQDAHGSLLVSAFSYAESVHLEGRGLHRPQGLGLSLECLAALAAAVGPLLSMGGFSTVQPACMLFLLGLVCSAPLLSLRVVACDCLVEMLSRSPRPDAAGALLLKTPCVDSFKQTLSGPHDDLAISCAQTMMVLARSSYSAHVYLLSSLGAVLAMIGNPSTSTARISSLAELFLALSRRSGEVLDTMVDLPDITPFLELCRSTLASRRDVVQQWLETFGTSMYEVDEIIEAFRRSTLSGFLCLAAHCTLEPTRAQDFRRCMFAAVRRRLATWRASVFGIAEFFSESLIGALVPMCELQADLVAAAVAMLHSLITHKEQLVLVRVWSGGHLGWLCQRMAHKSRAQLSLMRAGGDSATSSATAWDRHADLVATQAMSLRLIWRLRDGRAAEWAAEATEREHVVKNWREYMSYYCHRAWPLRESREIQEATEASIILAMQLAARLTWDSSSSMQQTLLQQGMLSVCSIVLLPAPHDQQLMHAAMGKTDSKDADGSAITPEDLALPDAKMIAGGIMVTLMQSREAYACLRDPKASRMPVAMLSQLYHWRAAMFAEQGSISVLATVGLLERSATLYMSLLSALTATWFIDHLGLARMGSLGSLFLDIWSRHPNSVLKHHALRMLSCFCQLHILYVSVMAYEPKAAMVSQAIHRTLGTWDIRELRHVMRLFVAALSHALGIPVMPEHAVVAAAEGLRMPEAASLRDVLQKGGVLRANLAANRHLLLSKYLMPMLEWCEHPGDAYGRLWALWVITTMLVHDAGSARDAQQKQVPRDSSAKDEGVMVFPVDIEERHLLRRAKILAEQQAVALHKEAKGDPLKSAIPGEEARGPQCRTGWLRGSPRLGAVLARMAGSAVGQEWRESQLVGCVSAARCLVAHPHFLCNAVETVAGAALLRLVVKPDQALSLASLLFVAMVSSYRLPLKPQNCAGDFLTGFYDLQETVIVGLTKCGESPYDLIATWLHAPWEAPPCPADFRCLVSFMVGQCVCPPLAVAPSLDATEGRAQDQEGPPSVAECGPPPQGLLDRLADDVLQEERRMRDAQAAGEGPMFSTVLCHSLYALAAMVPLHPEAATNSSVRGAAFAQLMKVQQIVARSIQPQALFDLADEGRAKLFLYIRAITCIRLALRVITGSWFAADIGVQFAISEQGGRDFMQYCTKHITQVYNSKTAVMRLLGTPWERVMLSQGPTETMAELLLVVCSSDSNLLELTQLGGEQALQSLSQYAERPQVRQQATMLLSKLAVLQA